jgi:hypothetical protein
MSTFRQREKAEKPKPRSALLSLIYLIIVAGASYYLAGLVMDQVDLYKVFGLRGSEIPLIKVPGQDVPEWALQLTLAFLIFFILQPLVVIVSGLFIQGKKKDEFDQLPPGRWQS